MGGMIAQSCPETSKQSGVHVFLIKVVGGGGKSEVQFFQRVQLLLS